jgi:hypothetical protein
MLALKPPIGRRTVAAQPGTRNCLASVSQPLQQSVSMRLSNPKCCMHIQFCVLHRLQISVLTTLTIVKEKLIL